MKFPAPGRVKTRLAFSLGNDEAARIYRSICESVIASLRGGPYRMVVYYDPPDAESEIRSWLGPHELEYLAQPEGDLGHRLRQAFEWGFGQADEVCVVGTDVPGLDRHVVENAFERLAGDAAPDAVFGPAVDGGYYLLALRVAAPFLFEGVPWSTEEVLAESLARARKSGLRVALVETMRDVDNPEDVPEALRR